MLGRGGFPWVASVLTPFIRVSLELRKRKSTSAFAHAQWETMLCVDGNCVDCMRLDETENSVG